MWDIWRRHKRKFYLTAGVLGSGYLLYKLYDAHKRKLFDLERELAGERENDEFIKAQMQEHFANIQRIADTTTLPHSMSYLRNQVAEMLDHLHLTEKLTRGKGQPNTLTPAEKLELWDELKLLSFTKTMLSLWSLTMLNLYIRVQVNILGRHLYIETARCFGPSDLLEEADLIDRNDQQQFLASADFLSNEGMLSLIAGMQAAVSEVLIGRQWKDLFNATILHETFVQILDTFMSNGSPHHWINCLMPENDSIVSGGGGSGSIDRDPSDLSKLDQLMMEARAVLSSNEFGNIVEISLKRVVDLLVEDSVQFGGDYNLSTTGIPLAKLVPRVAQMSSTLLEEPTNNNRYIQTIQKNPDVEFFFTLLYANMPIS
ncbi:peroxisome biogenesis protein 3-2-like [Impatiens glandulifera]|uniref:peroxisome biogenesis protein 3-2-like n=1 Tax=Impatiens glandulifera TaxID=253017 RepID=UPI001FB17F35|nr:peroxisome biogenesis protein 3-2-like [Impatiens glandulifera]